MTCNADCQTAWMIGLVLIVIPIAIDIIQELWHSAEDETRSMDEDKKK